MYVFNSECLDSTFKVVGIRYGIYRGSLVELYQYAQEQYPYWKIVSYGEISEEEALRAVKDKILELHPVGWIGS